MAASPANHNLNHSSASDTSNKADFILYGSQMRPNSNRSVARRGSSFVRMATEDQSHGMEDPNHHRAARLIRSDARRGSSFVKAMSEDVAAADDFNKYLMGKPFVRPDPRRGSSLLMVDDGSNEQDSTSRSSNDIRRGSSFIRTADDSLQGDQQQLFSKSPLNNKVDIRRGSSFIRTADDSLEEAPPARRLEMRRGSSFIRMMSEDINNDEMHSTGRLSGNKAAPAAPDSRRGSGVSKMLSEDSSEESYSRRSSKADMRRGSSLARMISEELNNDGEENQSKELPEKIRKALENNAHRQRHSLESISEYKAQTFSSASLYPSADYSTLSMESTSDFSSDYAMMRTHDDQNDDQTYVNSSSLSYLSWIESVTNETAVASVPAEVNTNTDNNDNRSGEWHNFWTNYNSSRNEYFSSPYLCPSNSGEDLSYESNGSTQRGFTDKSIPDHVVLTAEEVNEALNCTQRLMDILRGALKRSETEIILAKQDAEEQNVSITCAEIKSIIILHTHYHRFSIKTRQRKRNALNQKKNRHRKKNHLQNPQIVVV